MKKLQKLLTVLLALCLFASSMTGCDLFSDGEETPATTETIDLTGYAVLRGEDAGNDVVTAASKFFTALKKQSGVSVTFTTDYVNESKGETVPETGKEILFGVTNRTESKKNLRYSDYSVEFTNERIVIAAGSADALTKAGDWFLTNCVDGETVTVKNLPYTYESTYDLEDLKISGVALKDFAVPDVEGAGDDAIRKWAGTRGGIRQTSESGHEILVQTSGNLYLNEVACEYKKGNLILSYSELLGESDIVYEFFREGISGQKKSVVFEDSMIMEDYEIQNLPECDVRKATATDKLFFGTTGENSLEYTVGDDVVFNLALYAGSKMVSCPKITWEARTDDGKTYKGESSGATGRLVVKIPATGTGAIHLKAYAKDEKGNLIDGIRQSADLMEPSSFGAIVNREAILPAKTEPSDFDSYWATQIGKISSVAPDAVEMTAFTPTSVVSIDGTAKLINNYDYYRVKIAAGEAGYARAVVSVPKGLSTASAKMTVVFFGYGVSDNDTYISEGQIVMTVNAHDIELGQNESYYKGLSLGNYCFSNNTKENSYFRKMILRDLQAVRFAKAYFGTDGVKVNGATSKTSKNLWNKTDLRVFGGSQGAFQGIAVAALDHDVTEGDWSYPWMCDVGGTSAGRLQSQFRPSYTDDLRYFDTTNFAKRLGKNFFAKVLTGLGDYVCPPSGTMALFNSFSCKVNFTFRQGMTHGYIPSRDISYTLTK